MVSERPDKPVDPDIELTAGVKARELRFEEVPETEVHPLAKTERENLPEEVQPGVTYRNARVRLRIASALVDAEGDPQGERYNDGLERPEDSDVKADAKKEKR
jgi:hypothetical protein